MSERTILCASTAEGEDYGLRRGRAITLAGGRIAAIDGAPAHEPGLFAMPALVNAHDHARPIRSSAFGAVGIPLELWLQYLALLPAVDPYLAAAASLGRSALGGCGAVMIHYTRTNGLTPLPQEAAEVARAARDVGVRIGFAVALKDRNPLVYGPSEPVLAAMPETARRTIEQRLSKPQLAPAEQIALVDEVAEAAGCDLVDVQYGPTGVQWCTPELLEAVAQASAETGRRVHMHCLETGYQRDWADREFPGGMLPFLKEIGLLSPRLTLAHCTHARPDELELIAGSGATITVNTHSNLALKSGIAPVAAMLKAGCNVALGLDGTSFDEDDDAFSEMRLAFELHRGWGFDETIAEPGMLRIATRNGRASVTGSADGGFLAAGMPADILLLDEAALDEHRLVADLSPVDQLFTHGRARHIAELLVAGRSIVRDGRLTGIDHAALQGELVDRFRHGMRSGGQLAAALPELGTAMRRHFRDPPCC
ncbi:amidohydrolase family protein [Jiella avicenniae]|uniref:Amidohydrolase family protein n=1 Tax=Jiella avicenniae TaxID=2907202 RepID=A0A9X1TAG1_9HYPH|nr:amidohydrolase family protein [Jiella avicenniae]MCE7027133.1 amidohydrolase family protein [Jiella avicenniae]